MRWLQYLLFIGIVVGLAHPAGLYLSRVFEGRPTFLDFALRPAESFLYRIFGVNREEAMSARTYTLCFLFFGALGTAGVLILLVGQQWLPGGPAGRYLTTPMTMDLAAN